MSVEVSPGVNIWGTFGYGKGEVEFSTGQNDAEQSGDATLWTGTMGVEGALQPVGVGDVVLSAAASVAQTEAGAVETQTYCALRQRRAIGGLPDGVGRWSCTSVPAGSGAT